MLQLQTVKGLITARKVIASQDVMELSDVICSSFKKLAGKKESTAERYLSQFNDEENYRFYVATNEKNQIVAGSEIRLFQDCARIERVATLEQFRCMGINRLMFNELTLDLLKSTSVSELILDCHTTMDSHYKNLGFSFDRDEWIDNTLAGHWFRKRIR